MYLLDVGIGATWFGIRRTLFTMEYGGTVESSVYFEIEGEWTRLADTWLENNSSGTLFLLACLFKIDLSSWVIFC